MNFIKTLIVIPHINHHAEEDNAFNLFTYDLFISNILETMKNNKLFLLIIFFSVSSLIYGYQPYDLEARFAFETNDDITYSDQYQLKAELEYDFHITKDFECELVLEADKYEIDVEEVFFRFEKGWYEIRAGKYKNKLLLKNILPSKDNPLEAKNTLTKMLVDMSYINHAIGAGIESEDEYLVNDYFYLNLQSIEAQFFEPQFNGGYLHKFKSIWAGFSGCYFPFFIKDNYIGDFDDPDNNYLINLMVFKHEGLFLYGNEITFGKNIQDPIGLLNSGIYSDRDYFLGGDFYGGLRLYLNETELIPLLRTSILFPDSENMECNIIDLSFNNKIGFSEDIRLDFALGIQIITEYDYTDTLVTSLDPLWNVSFKVFID